MSDRGDNWGTRLAESFLARPEEEQREMLQSARDAVLRAMNIKITQCPDGLFKAVCGDQHCFALTEERAIKLWHELYGGEQ